MHVTVIAKAPVPGRVKTRLCPPLTPESAAEVAAAALADTFAAVDRCVAGARAPGVRRVLLLDGPPGAWVPPGYDIVEQRGADLAERLADGFTRLGPGVIVGMDTPAACRYLAMALDAVRAGQDVMGLAEDGGYWVIGLARVDHGVFADVPMSHSHTGVHQLRRLHGLGRAVRMLPMARDLDDAADLAAALERGGEGRLGLLLTALSGR